MKNATELDSLDDAPLYIRWSPDRSPYAIELKLDLVVKITSALAQAEKAGAEIAGVLVGSFPDGNMPTLRVEEIEIIPAGPLTGPVNLDDPELQARYSEIRWNLRRSGRAALGLFRSHLRPGPLKPAAADRMLLSEEFSHAVYIALLIQGRTPHSAAFFVATDGQLPDEPAVREFRFNESEFRTLPEVQPETPAPTRERDKTQRSRIRFYSLIVALLLIGLAGCLLMWSFTSQSARIPWTRSGQQLGLAINGNGYLLRVSWNHSARELDGSVGATLDITDGTSRREIKLGSDELRLGSVEYQRTTSHVEATMTVNRPGRSIETASAAWYAK